MFDRSTRIRFDNHARPLTRLRPVFYSCAAAIQRHTGPTCVPSCQGQKPGNYQYCRGCQMYVSCIEGEKMARIPCPDDMVWDDKLKKCATSSTTCKPLDGKYRLVAPDDAMSTCSPGVCVIPWTKTSNTFFILSH